MSQILQNFSKFQEFQLDNLVDFKKCMNFPPKAAPVVDMAKAQGACDELFALVPRRLAPIPREGLHPCSFLPDSANFLFFSLKSFLAFLKTTKRPRARARRRLLWTFLQKENSTLTSDTYLGSPATPATCVEISTDDILFLYRSILLDRHNICCSRAFLHQRAYSQRLHFYILRCGSAFSMRERVVSSGEGV